MLEKNSVNIRGLYLLFPEFELSIYIIYFLLLFTFIIFTVITKQIFSIINSVKNQRLDIAKK